MSLTTSVRTNGRVYSTDALENGTVFLAVKDAQRISTQDIHVKDCASVIPDLFKQNRSVWLTLRQHERCTFSTSDNACFRFAAFAADSMRPRTMVKNRVESGNVIQHECGKRLGNIQWNVCSLLK